MAEDPFAGSKYMGGCNPSVPLHAWSGMNVRHLVEKVYIKGSYESRKLGNAAMLLADAAQEGKHIWVAMSGAATPAGLGGLVAQLIEQGVVQGIVSTGANVFHDLHYVFGLPMRQGSPEVDDNDVYKDGSTRIHDITIRGRETLKAQDMINQHYARQVFQTLKPPFSTATFLYEFGKKIIADTTSGWVKQKKGSLLLTAVEHDVPYFLDSGANHSLGMDLAALVAEGIAADTSPSYDVIEAAAFSRFCQPQFNLFIGEGGPRNFLQTTGPTAAEIFFMNFDGSEGGIILSTSDVRQGALSGSTFSEAKSWGKYEDAHGDNKVVVWGEYTITLPIITAYVIDRLNGQKLPHKRLMQRQNELRISFLEEARHQRPARDKEYAELAQDLERITSFEAQAREKRSI